MRARTMVICVLGFVGGMLAVPAVSLSLAQQHSAAPTAATRLSQGLTATHVQLQHAHRAASTNAAGVSVRAHGYMPNGFFGTAPARFLALHDNGCRFYVTTSQADANSWTGPNDPRSKPCSPTVSGFTPTWSGLPTAAQWTAYQHELGILAMQSPTITLEQAQQRLQAAVGVVQN